EARNRAGEIFVKISDKISLLCRQSQEGGITLARGFAISAAPRRAFSLPLGRMVLADQRQSPAEAFDDLCPPVLSAFVPAPGNKDPSHRASGSSRSVQTTESRRHNSRAEN